MAQQEASSGPPRAPNLDEGESVMINVTKSNFLEV
jgi:hypothetical protein